MSTNQQVAWRNSRPQQGFWTAVVQWVDPVGLIRGQVLDYLWPATQNQVYGNMVGSTVRLLLWSSIVGRRRCWPKLVVPTRVICALTLVLVLGPGRSCEGLPPVSSFRCSLCCSAHRISSDWSSLVHVCSDLRVQLGTHLCAGGHAWAGCGPVPLLPKGHWPASGGKLVQQYVAMRSSGR